MKPPKCEIVDSEELDLNLGLSLGGSYSQNPKEKPLIRTSSLNEDFILHRNEGRGFLSLARSSSLPTEAEQEMRKLKELQAMKRMEAKRRMLEKHRHSRGGSSEEERSQNEIKMPNWTVESAVKNTVLCHAIEKIRSNVSPSPNLRIQGVDTAADLPIFSQPIVSSTVRESGKSVVSTNYRSEPMINFGTMLNGKRAVCHLNYHSAPQLEKMENGLAVNSSKSRPYSMFLSRTISNGKPVEPAETEQERPSKKAKVSDNDTRDINTMNEMMKLMPSVTTTGDGPNGKKIDGLLYRYKKGQVSIVCVCHGNFLSPSEFIKHAGGTDMVNPMKHINVLPATL
ncbi:ninja-family protein AFP3-like [Diospyros lotus]|uniref:ninja-family protein AFP3-like n=1 Tax=Diospyros lotus TaxID=55363 RepID=UPI0022502CDF|nr:ninja-family protein AFP3-like [Diospyros lotus]XP_052179388.1 ninja-family protein AFP3-like [Diospyros lotus]XP_052179389.1 ninja-family protein AFP3-like [Diospyros lotus]